MILRMMMIDASLLNDLITFKIPDQNDLPDEKLDIIYAENFSDDRQACPVDCPAHHIPGLDGQIKFVRRIFFINRQRLIF